MTRTFRSSVFALCAALSLGSLAFGAAPAPAQEQTDCGSSRNLMFVHRRLEGVIKQLDADTNDYGGHRVNAISTLAKAQSELDGAEKYAVDTEHQDPSCFQAHARPGGNWGGHGGGQSGGAGGGQWGGPRNQGASDYSIGAMNDRVQKLTSQLQSDNENYGGHKSAAISALQAASTELEAADAYAKSHGN